MCRGKAAQDSAAVQQPRSAAEAHASAVGRSWLRWELGREAAAQRDAARQRLTAVLETYTDVTRFPRCKGGLPSIPLQVLNAGCCCAPLRQIVPFL